VRKSADVVQSGLCMSVDDVAANCRPIWTFRRVLVVLDVHLVESATRRNLRWYAAPMRHPSKSYRPINRMG
jgi:hypothetical protein